MLSKLIVALDFSTESQAWQVIKKIDPEQCGLKVGSEMFTLFGPDFIRQLTRLGYKIFLDLKFHDIPNTVAQSCRSAAELGVWMINVHASGGLTMMKQAKAALSSYAEPPLLIAVTVLTSMNTSELPSIGIHNALNDQVTRLAKLSFEANLDGVVCSAYEVPAIKAISSEKFLTVTPGIRLPDNDANDQSRIITPVDAIAMGSDYLVVGRPITKASQPEKVINSILDSISI